MTPNSIYSLVESFLLENNCYSEVVTKLFDENTTLLEICESGNIKNGISRILSNLSVPLIKHGDEYWKHMIRWTRIIYNWKVYSQVHGL